MRRLNLAIAAAVALALPAVSLAESWQNAPMVDRSCSGTVKGDPDKHPTSCALKCADSGYGVLKADGSFVPFDKAGNQKALAALKATKKADHLRVNVTGEMKDGVIAVASLALTE
jgi:hypothetical protein